MQCQNKFLHYYFSAWRPAEASLMEQKFQDPCRISALAAILESSGFPNACSLILIFHVLVNGFLATTRKCLVTDSLFHEVDPLLMVYPSLPRCPSYLPLYFTCLFCSLGRDFRAHYEAHRPRFILGSTIYMRSFNFHKKSIKVGSIFAVSCYAEIEACC